MTERRIEKGLLDAANGQGSVHVHPFNARLNITHVVSADSRFTETHTCLAG